MAEYNVQINKYNVNNADYDQLYPQPMKHAETHLLNGSDPINIGGLGVSNPNLLDNSYWASADAIIDQRGGYVVTPGTEYYSDTASGSSPVGTTTAYYTATVLNIYWVAITISGATYYVPMTAAVRGYTGDGYGIDRWYQQPGLVTTISENGLTLICTASYNRFRHYMEGIAIAGKTVTASILTASGELIASTGVFSAGNTMRITGYNLYFRFEVESNRCVFDFFFGEGGGSITIKAAKLELGSVQTLAHQDENGNWVLNDPPPDKGMELLKCIQSTADPSDTYANKVVATRDWAVCKAGDTMTGALLNTIDSIGRASFVGTQNAAYLESFRSDYNTRRQIVLKNIEEDPNDASALFMWNSTSNKISTILHTGNKDQIFTYGTADLTAGTSALETGKLYFVYE